MIRFLHPFLFVAVFVTGGVAAHSQTLSNFSNFSNQLPTFSGSWEGGNPTADQYIQNASSISIAPVNSGNPQDDGDFLVDTSSAPINIGTFGNIAFTLQVDAGNADTSLKVLLYDGNFKTATATFNLSGLTTGTPATLISALSFSSGFLKSDVEAWQVAGGQAVAANNTRLTFDNIAVVPEPSTYALFVAGALGLGVAARRRRVLA